MKREGNSGWHNVGVEGEREHGVKEEKWRENGAGKKKG